MTMPLNRSGMPSFVSWVNSKVASCFVLGTSTKIVPGHMKAWMAEPRFSIVPFRPTSRYSFGPAFTTGMRYPR